MSCDSETVIQTAEIQNTKSNFAAIKTVVESNEATTTTPDGKVVDTLAGSLKKLAWETPALAYASALSFSASDGRKIIERDDIFYAPVPSRLPFTTTTWVGVDENNFYPINVSGDRVGGLTGFTFSTVAEMALLTTVDGEVVTPALGRRFSTLGFTNVNDGGQVDYVVTNDTPNGIDKIDLGGGFTATRQILDRKVFGTVAEMKLASIIDDTYISTNRYYNSTDGGGATYRIKTAAQASTDGDVIDGYGNHTLANGNVAILQNPTTPKQVGAHLDGVTDDSLYIKNMVETLNLSVIMQPDDIMFLSTAATYPISISQGLTVSGGNITSDVQINFGVDNDVRLFEVDASDVTFKNTTVDLAQTITGVNNGLGTFCRFTENSYRFLVDNCVFKNVYSEAYVYLLAVNANSRDWLICNCSFENLDVKENAVEGDLNGSLRGIYVGYQKVGVYNNAISGSGTIDNVAFRDLLQYQDTDAIQLIGTTGHVFGDFVVKNVYCENVGKRGVKAQHEGVLISDVTVDARNISHSLGYMFSAVAALNDNVTIENVYGIGVFKAGVSTARSVKLRNITLVSTAGVGSISGTWTAFLHDFGGTYDVSDVTISGNWLNHFYIGAAGFTTEPIFEIFIDKMQVSSVAEAESIRIDSSLNSATTMTLVRLSNIAGCETSDTSRSALRIGRESDLTNPNIARIELENIQAAANGYFTTVTTNSVRVFAHMLVLSGATSASFEGAYHSAGRISNVTSSGQARLANFSNCSNMFVTSSECVDKSSDYAVRFNNSSNSGVSNMLLGNGMSGAIINSGSATNNQSTAIIII